MWCTSLTAQFGSILLYTAKCKLLTDRIYIRVECTFLQAAESTMTSITTLLNKNAIQPNQFDMILAYYKPRIIQIEKEIRRSQVQPSAQKTASYNTLCLFLASKTSKNGDCTTCCLTVLEVRKFFFICSLKFSVCCLLSSQHTPV